MTLVLWYFGVRNDIFWIGWEKVEFWLGTGSLLNIFRSEVEFLISKSPPLDLFRKNLSN